MIKFNSQSITLLDCTLRDGGYYNNWCYSNELVNDYLLAMSAIGVCFVELGFRSLDFDDFKGPLAFTSEAYLNTLTIPEGLNVGVMVNCSDLVDQDTAIDKLFLHSTNSKISFVRIASQIEDVDHAVVISKKLKGLGYLVAINIMQIADKSYDEIRSVVNKIPEASVDVLYFADSMGSLQPNDISKIVDEVRSGWSGPIGIHAHDSMGLALSNSVQALNAGVTWVDSTVSGMGRGPGNVHTELLLIKLTDETYDISSLSSLFSLIARYFDDLKKTYKWGMNPYYFLAGKYGIHPSYIQEMLGDTRYQEEDILVAIEYLRNMGAKRFNIQALDGARSFYNDNPKGVWNPQEIFKGKEVLIVGGGATVSDHKIAIEDYIKRKNPLVLVLNTSQQIDSDLIDLRIASHPIRLMADCDKYTKYPQPLITPVSMLPSEIVSHISNCQLYDYGVSVQHGIFDVRENYSIVPSSVVFAYALAVVTAGNASRVLFAGIDGFSEGDPRQIEMENILAMYQSISNRVPLLSVTPTKYLLNTTSIYAI